MWIVYAESRTHNLNLRLEDTWAVNIRTSGLVKQSAKHLHVDFSSINADCFDFYGLKSKFYDTIRTMFAHMSKELKRKDSRLATWRYYRQSTAESRTTEAE